MTGKSHVSMEQHECFICGKLYDTGAVLLDRRLRQSLERHTVTGSGLCPEHQKIHDDGFIFLIECDPEKSERPGASGTLKASQVHRTGVVTQVRRDLFLELFDLPPSQRDVPAVYVEPRVNELLKTFVQAATN